MTETVSVYVRACVFVFIYTINDVTVQNCHGYNSFLTFLKTKKDILGYIVTFMYMSINSCPQTNGKKPENQHYTLKNKGSGWIFTAMT